MKQILSALCIIFLITSCSPESTPGTEEKQVSFNIQLEPSTLSPGVDEMVIVQVETSNTLKDITWIREGVTRSHIALGNEGIEQSELYFQFPQVGTYPIEFEFTDYNGTILKKQLSFNVQRGNTVQITGVEINNYFDKGKTWDPEFTEDNDNRLADLVFSLAKLQHVNITEKEFNLGTWFISDVHENESSFSWDLTSEQLFFNPMYTFHFGLGDADEGNIGQNIMLDSPTRPVDLRPYIETKPASILFEVPSIDLEVTFHLDWP